MFKVYALVNKPVWNLAVGAMGAIGAVGVVAAVPAMHTCRTCHGCHRSCSGRRCCICRHGRSLKMGRSNNYVLSNTALYCAVYAIILADPARVTTELTGTPDYIVPYRVIFTASMVGKAVVRCSMVIFITDVTPIEVMQVTSQALVRWSLSHFGCNKSYCTISILYHLCSYHGIISFYSL